jgi:hypothetical protein
MNKMKKKNSLDCPLKYVTGEALFSSQTLILARPYSTWKASDKRAPNIVIQGALKNEKSTTMKSVWIVTGSHNVQGKPAGIRSFKESAFSDL